MVQNKNKRAQKQKTNLPGRAAEMFPDYRRKEGGGQEGVWREGLTESLPDSCAGQFSTPAPQPNKTTMST